MRLRPRRSTRTETRGHYTTLVRTPYIGGESKAAGVNRVIRPAANEKPLGPGPLSVAAYEAEKTQLHRYPDGGATVLRQAIAEAESLDAARIDRKSTRLNSRH